MDDVRGVGRLQSILETQLAKGNEPDVGCWERRRPALGKGGHYFRNASVTLTVLTGEGSAGDDTSGAAFSRCAAGSGGTHVTDVLLHLPRGPGLSLSPCPPVPPSHRRRKRICISEVPGDVPGEQARTASLLFTK